MVKTKDARQGYVKRKLMDCVRWSGYARRECCGYVHLSKGLTGVNSGLRWCIGAVCRTRRMPLSKFVSSCVTNKFSFSRIHVMNWRLRKLSRHQLLDETLHGTLWHSLLTLYGILVLFLSNVATLHDILETFRSALSKFHSTLETLCGATVTFHDTLATLRGILVTFHGTLKTLRGTLATFHGILTTLHVILVTFHST